MAEKEEISRQARNDISTKVEVTNSVISTEATSGIERHTEAPRKKSENLVKKTCRELGITQKELAEKTGFSEDSISKWNNGSKMPKSAENFFNTLTKLSKYNDLENLINQINKLT